MHFRCLTNKVKNRIFLDTILLAEQNGQTMDVDGVRDEVNTFLFEGSDTTASAIIFTLLLLANHQDEQIKCYREIMEVTGTQRLMFKYLIFIYIFHF